MNELKQGVKVEIKKVDVTLFIELDDAMIEKKHIFIRPPKINELIKNDKGFLGDALRKTIENA